jgi:YD repeat-containing protein
VSDSWTRSGFGELSTYEATVLGGVLLHQEYTHDDSGRITRLEEATSNATVLHEYGYDAAGRLETVKLNGTITATYTYDLNGNRLTKTTQLETQNSSCDGQDRIVTNSDAIFTYTPNGELLTRNDASGESAYMYDELGDLLAVHTPDQHVISYTADGEGRRIAKDPVAFRGRDTNLYAYVWNDPINLIDPSGLWGVGSLVGGEAKIGQGAVGAGGQLDVGSGIFFNSKCSGQVSLGDFSASGSFAGGPTKDSNVHYRRL